VAKTVTRCSYEVLIIQGGLRGESGEREERAERERRQRRERRERGDIRETPPRTSPAGSQTKETALPVKVAPPPAAACPGYRAGPGPHWLQMATKHVLSYARA
jgi:hypothetical protein